MTAASTTTTDDQVIGDGAIIDLRDPNVATGLAAALESIVSLSERAGAAEARAEWNRNERMVATGKVRQLNSDLEQESAQRHRLEVELASYRRELVLRQEQLDEARQEIRRVHDQLRRAVATADHEVTTLRSELAASHRSLHLLEALVGRRKRRTHKALVAEHATGKPASSNVH